MAEYIEREAAISKLRLVEVREASINFAASMLSEIKRIPAADVQPVRHGRWVEVCVEDMGDLLVASMRCDQCNRYHNEVYHYGNPTEMAHFCGFCGADMREAGQ